MLLMSVLSYSIHIGSGFTCYDTKRMNTTYFKDEDNANLTSIATLSLGEMINSGTCHVFL